MKRPNAFVLAAILCVNVFSGILVGHFQGTLNGVLEMDGFKETFSNLYIAEEDQPTNSGSGHAPEVETVNSLPHFCGSPDDFAESSNVTKTCGSGSGAGSSTKIGLVASVLSLGAIFGSLVSGWISDRLSRKVGHVIGAVLHTVGSVIAAAAYHIEVLMVGRFIGGFATGIMYMVTPLYVAEITPKDSRGFLVSLIGLTFGVGYLLALCTNVGFAKFSAGWRVTFALSGVMGAVYIILLKFIPHSPRWLVMRGRDEEAVSILCKINCQTGEAGEADARLQLKEVKESAVTMSGRQRCLLLLQWKYIYRMFLLMISFALAPLLGAFILTYVTTFFCEVGLSPFYAALAVGVNIFVSSLVQSVFVDKFGRRALLLAFTVLNIAAALPVAVLTQLCASSSGVVAYAIVILMCIYAFGYSSSWLTLPWVINSEVFPTNVRGPNVAISTGFFWIVAFLANQFIPLMLYSLKVHGFMYYLVGVSIFAFFFALLVLPETKGVSLEDMDKLFSQGFWKRFTCKMCSSVTPPSMSIAKDIELDDKTDSK